MKQPKIAVIHATQVSLAPISLAFAQAWDDAEVNNILDEGLSRDRQRQADLTSDLYHRILSLAIYAQDCGAQAILYACSAFGEAIDAAAREVSIPVLKPNEAMFRAAMNCGDKLALLVTFEPAGPSMAAEFEQMSQQQASPAQLEVVYVAGALDALQRGDQNTHNALIAEAAKTLRFASAIMLGQFSMASATSACEDVTDAPVFSSPGAAVQHLSKLLLMDQGQ